jgi:uncharacterized protein with GYD domain
MPTFITQGRFTAEAMRGLLSHPEDRSKQVEKLFAASGGKLLGYYLTFGDYDFLIVSEGPSEGVATSTIAAAASGEVTDLKTQLALPASAMVEAFSRAGPIAAGFRAPQAEAGKRPQAAH